MEYRRKEIINALQWTGNNQAEIKAFARQFAMFDYADTNHDGVTFDAVLKVKTAEKIIPLEIGDYVILQPKGDFTVMNRDDFEKLYEKA